MKVAIVSFTSAGGEASRAKNLARGFSSLKDVEVITVNNERRDSYKYYEVFKTLMKVRAAKKPDLYIVSFSGYRVLPIVLFVSGKTPVVYDEFINPIEWLIYENHLWDPHSMRPRTLISIYRYLVSKCRYILSDTKVHSEYSAMLNDISLEKYIAVPLGVDEQIFKPAKLPSSKAKSPKFKIFYNAGSTRHSHGFSYVLSAAVKLKDKKQIEFEIVSAKGSVDRDIKKAQKLGAKIKIIESGEGKIASAINRANVCLGGPFGGTVQSKLIITEKSYQSLACAKPTLIGQTKVNKLFSDRKNCLIVDQGSGQAIAEKILWALKNNRYLPAIGQNGYRLYRDQLSNDVIQKQCKLILSKAFL